jgi:hypothetical protein
MGNASGKPAEATRTSGRHAPKASVPAAQQNQPTQKGSKTLVSDNEKYNALRDDLMSFSLGEASHDYAARLLAEQPENPAIQALYGETIYQYEKLKNPTRREHWCDRIDLLQKGILTTKKCMKDHPEYAPCWRVYMLLAVKAADQEYWFQWIKPLGLMKHYTRLNRRGERALELNPQSGDLNMAMAELHARVAHTNHWRKPYRLYGLYHNNPPRWDCLLRSKELHLKAAEQEPNGIENATRLGIVFWELGDDDSARRWYTKARDALTPRDPSEDIWQTVAHTHLCVHFAKSAWNTPFG